MIVQVCGGQVRYRVATEQVVPASGGYELVLAQHGLYRQADRPCLQARVVQEWFSGPLPELKCLTAYVRVASRVPAELLAGALRWLGEGLAEGQPFRERCVQFALGPAGWRLHVPPQEGFLGRVRFDAGSEPEGVLVELHSHPGRRPFFSGQDDRDEQGFRVYGVVARLGDQTVPRLRLRVGVYGVFGWVSLGAVFGPGADELVADGVVDGADEDGDAVQRTSWLAWLLGR